MIAQLSFYVKIVSICWWLYLLLYPVLPAAAQTKEATAKLLTSFRFEQMTGGIILLKAAIDNHPDSLNFILDTGSGGISLDSITCQRLGIRTEPSNRTIRGIAGVKQVDFAYNHTLHLPGLNVSGMNFHINDYELLTSVYGVKIDGIIGYSLFSRYIVLLNYDSHEIALYTQGKIPYPERGFFLTPTIAGLPIQDASVADQSKRTGRFYLDTGAGLNLLFSSAYVRDSGLFAQHKQRYATVAEGLGGKTSMEMTVLKKFKLGPYGFRNVPVYMFDDEFNVTAYPQLGGLIGNDILRRFNAIIDYSTSRFHLTPNTHFYDAFDYSYTGLGMYQQDDLIVISDVIPGSPADKAGMQVDDVVVAIENNLSNNIQTYKQLLMQSGKKVRLVLSRDNELFECTLYIESIRKKLTAKASPKSK
ncbi:MAG: aspartyl protease family protein [Bacteroidetes bacterium]|uniref:aspartyl protease family protein n=1 Tax=Phnomibacter sp. TaxID=2836217 RepID=UPI002FDCD5B0|nr:aspartyl protease family protein [Bacteroidota bacterium]